jgi:hypothetical protein
MLTRVLTIAMLVGCGPSVYSQSLAEVAAKEKERRAKVGGSAKAFTDSDLRDAASKSAKEGSPSTSNPPSSVAPTTDASSAQAADARDGSAVDSSSSEAKKSRGAEYKVRLDATNTSLKVAEESLRAAQQEWTIVSDHSWQFAGHYERARSRFEAAKKRVELLRRERDEIEDAARREGIPPGYLR